VRKYRHKKMTGEDQSFAAVVPLTPAKTGRKPPKSERAKPAVIGAAEQAILDQAASAPKSQDLVGTVMQARILARILDDEDCKAMWPTTSRQIHTLMLSLAPPKSKSQGRLYAIRKMSNRRPRGANDAAALGD
jgi:hypothetical protein